MLEYRLSKSIMHQSPVKPAVKTCSVNERSSIIIPAVQVILLLAHPPAVGTSMAAHLHHTVVSHFAEMDAAFDPIVYCWKFLIIDSVCMCKNMVGLIT